MRATTERKRFYCNAINQRKTMAILVLCLLITFIYGAGLKHRSIGVTFMILSFVYPLVILLGFLQDLKALNYIDVDEDGAVTTYLGLFHRTTRWAEVESMTEVTINGAKSIGINFLPAYKKRRLGSAMTMRLSGYESLLRQGVGTDGQTFTEWVSGHLLQSSPRGSKKTVSKQQAAKMASVEMKQSFKIDDLWTKPYGISLVGASMVCDIIAGMLKHKYHFLSSMFGTLGFIAMIMAGASLFRLRRVNAKAAKRQTKQPNSWTIPS